MKTQHVTLCLDSIIPETLIDGGRTLHDGTHRNLNGWNSNGTHIQTDNQSIKMGGVKTVDNGSNHMYRFSCSIRTPDSVITQRFCHGSATLFNFYRFVYVCHQAMLDRI